jgi:Lipocalin-like domain
MYGNDGRMLTVITNGGRPKSESIAKMTDAQRVELFNTLVAYGGTYKFDGKKVDHYVDICWDEVRCGTIVLRDVERDGDKLIYTTKPAPFSQNGRMSIVTLVWHKLN